MKEVWKELKELPSRMKFHLVFSVSLAVAGGYFLFSGVGLENGSLVLGQSIPCGLGLVLLGIMWAVVVNRTRSRE